MIFSVEATREKTPTAWEIAKKKSMGQWRQPLNPNFSNITCISEKGYKLAGAWKGAIFFSWGYLKFLHFFGAMNEAGPPGFDQYKLSTG